MGLTINREKTRVVQLKDRGASLDFLGFSFRYEPDQFGRPKRFLNHVPSAKACARERAHLRGLIHARRNHVPIPQLIAQVNSQVCGWAGYFRHGRSRPAFRALNWYLQQRMVRHLKGRSQRPYRPPAGVSWYAHLHRQLGLVRL
jgi:RNA-directed DNA polymerase